MRVTMSNFVKIGQIVAEILRFFGFPRWRPPPSWIFKNANFYRLIRLQRPNLRQSAKFHQDTVDPLLRYGEFSIFQDGGCPPCWIFIVARHHVKFCQNQSNGCRDIAILQFSKMAAAAILDFQKFKYLTASTFERSNLRYCAKFHQDRPIRC